MFTAYVRTKVGNVALCALPSRRRDAEVTAANMGKTPDVERVRLAVYGRIIGAFKDGIQIDLEISSRRGENVAHADCSTPGGHSGAMSENHAVG